MVPGQDFDGVVGRFFLEYQRTEYGLVFLEAAPHGDGGSLGGGDGHVQVVGMPCQDLMVLAMLFVCQFCRMAPCRGFGLTKAVRDGGKGDLRHL